VNVGILFGGNSKEHEISIISAYQIKNKLKYEYDIHMIYIDIENNVFIADKMKLDDFKCNNYKKLKKTNFILGGVKGVKLDIAVLAGHGENSEDGIFASLMRFYNIKYVGCDLLASSICIDKHITYNYLSNNKINMINSYLYSYNDYINGQEFEEYPLILKPLCGGSSIGIFVIKDESQRIKVLNEAFNITDKFIVQKYYDNIIEYNLAIDDYGYSRLERIVKKNDIFSFENKYNESFKQFHQFIGDDILYDEFKRVGRCVYDLLNCSGIIRIDFFLIDGIIYVNEVNTTPGALAMYLYDDFNLVMRKLINNVLLKDYPKYEKGNFLSSSNINK
jgi:D-alanine-D-alanine ligase